MNQIRLLFILVINGLHVFCTYGQFQPSSSSSPGYYNIQAPGVRRPSKIRHPYTTSNQSSGNNLISNYYNNNDEEKQIASTEYIDSFLTRENRNSFIARVYAILSVQLGFTAAVVLLFTKYKGITFWMVQSGRMVVPWLSLVISAISMFVISFSETQRQKSPNKFLWLSLFTFGEAIAIGFISSFYSVRTVLSALLSTAASTSAVTFYTLFNKNKKYDLTQWGRILSSVTILFLVYGLSTLLFPNAIPRNDLLYSLVGSTLFLGYLSYHTRLITSGKHDKYRMNEKDYVYAAMMLYNDIINIFIYILQILGDERPQRNSD